MEKVLYDLLVSNEILRGSFIQSLIFELKNFNSEHFIDLMKGVIANYDKK